MPEFEILHLAPPGKGAELNADDRPAHVAGYRLAYPITGGSGNPEAREVIADAHTGAVLQRIPRAHLSRPAVGTGHTLFSGPVRLDTAERPDGRFELADPTRGGNRVVDSGKRPAVPLTALTNASNAWGDSLLENGPAPPGSATDLTTAADAAYGLQVGWDYFGTVHFTESFDVTDQGVTLDLGGFPYPDTAAWVAERRTVAIGPSIQLWPQVSLFTVGHELTHAVTGARPVFRYGATEAGGLNEATSDFFAQMMVTWKGSGGGRHTPMDATIGDEGTPLVYTQEKRDVSGGFAPELLRDLCKPSLDGQSYDEWAPDFLGKDPHLTSGPMNRVLQFLRQGVSTDPASRLYSRRLPEGMDGIGNDRTAQLWFDALHEVGSTGGYLDARREMLRSAIRLHGPGSAPHLAVRKAFGAINVGNPRAASDGFDLTGSFTGARAEVVGPDLVLAAGLTDVDGVKGVLFKVDGIPVGRVDAAPFTLTLDASRLFRNGSHSFQAIAANFWGQTMDGPRVPFTLDNPVQQLLDDPGLEATHPLAVKWRETPAAGHGPGIIQDLAGRPGEAHGGTRCAVFQELAGSLSQRVTLPAGIRSARLELWRQGVFDPIYPGDNRSSAPPGGGGNQASRGAHGETRPRGGPTMSFKRPAPKPFLWTASGTDILVFSDTSVSASPVSFKVRCAFQGLPGTCRPGSGSSPRHHRWP